MEISEISALPESSKRVVPKLMELSETIEDVDSFQQSLTSIKRCSACRALCKFLRQLRRYTDSYEFGAINRKQKN